MKHTTIAVALAMLLCVVAAGDYAGAKTLFVDCAKKSTVSDALRRAVEGDIIQVTGTCSDNVNIAISRVTLEGVGYALIEGADLGLPVIAVTGVQGVNIKNMPVRRGQSGILITDGAITTLQKVTMQDSEENNLLIRWNSTAKLTDCTATGAKAYNGIDVRENSRLHLAGTTTATSNNNNGVLLYTSSLTLDSGVLIAGSNGHNGVLLNMKSI